MIATRNCVTLLLALTMVGVAFAAPSEALQMINDVLYMSTGGGAY